jgi:hypothetical protein
LFRGDYSGRPRITVTNWNGNPSSPKWYIDNVPVPAQFTAYWDRMQAAGDTEKNAFIFDGDRGYHIYAPTRDMTQIQAGSVLRSNGSGFNDNRVSPWTRASGFSSATGLVLKSELDAGRVDHALACAWPKNRISGPSWTTANTFVDPATSSDGSAGTGGAKMGSRIQLNPSLTEAQLRSFGVSDYYLPLARALQEYGCYIVESSSWMTIYAESHNDSGPVNWPSGWHPGSAQLVPHLRIVAPPPAPVYDTHHVFGQPHR